MRNVTGQAVIGDDLYGREYEPNSLWKQLERGEHVLMLAPRRVGKTSLMLEVRRKPCPSWDVLYVDVEGARGAADCFAAILAELAANPTYRRGIEGIPGWNAIASVLKHFPLEDGERLRFHSNLLRQWWSNHHAGPAS